MTASAPAAIRRHLAPGPGRTVAADLLDRQAGRAWRAGDLSAAARLIAGARRLDPGRAALWDQREKLIGGGPPAAPDVSQPPSLRSVQAPEPGPDDPSGLTRFNE